MHHRPSVRLHRGPGGRRETRPAGAAAAAAALAEAVAATFRGSEGVEASEREAALATVYGAAASAAPGRAWDDVRDALLRWCGCDALVDLEDPGPSDGNAADGSEDDGEDAWEALAASERHGDANTSASRFPALAATSAAARRAADARRDAPPTPRSRQLPRLVAAALRRARLALEAAHATYECAKLDAARAPTLAKLGRLCRKLAAACCAAHSATDRDARDAALEGLAILERHAADAGLDEGADETFSLTATLGDVGRWAAGATARRGGAKLAPFVAPDVVAALEDAAAGEPVEVWAAALPRRVRERVVRDEATSDDRADAGIFDRLGSPDARSDSGVFAWASDACSFFASAAASASASRRGDARLAKTHARRCAAKMCSAGFARSDIARLPVGVSIPLRDALRRARADPPRDWPAAAYALVGREDLAAARRLEAREGTGREGGFDRRDAAASPDSSRPFGGDGDALLTGVFGDGDGEYGEYGDVGASGGDLGDAGGSLDAGVSGLDAMGSAGDRSGEAGGGSSVEASGSASSEGAVSDGMAHLEAYVGPLLFGRDRRLREVRALLSSASPAPIASGGGGDGAGEGEGGGGDAEASARQRLPRAAHRRARVGRGALPWARGARRRRNRSSRRGSRSRGASPRRETRRWSSTWVRAPAGRRFAAGPNSTTAPPRASRSPPRTRTTRG